MSKYTIGIDFGTLSGRAVLIRISDGKQISSAEMKYPHGVMDETLPDGQLLPIDWALQHPQDYLDVLEYTFKKVICDSAVNPSDIIGIGVDFTACTILPVKKDGTPLCFLDEFKNNRNAYVKLWKHHSAQDKADIINELANKDNELWIKRFGGKISSEWLIPKVWQTLEEAPEVYDAADYFIEGGDWIVWQLTGNHTRNACTAGFKANWHKGEGYPPIEFLNKLDPRLNELVTHKINMPISSVGEKAGGLTENLSRKTGLQTGTSVAVAHADAHVAFPGVKITKPGVMLDIIGTSSCHLIMDEEEYLIPGISGVVADGIIPGYYSYEAGQNGVGDTFHWFTSRMINESYINESKEREISIHDLLIEKAKKLEPGESGLVMLEWLNGNRSTLNDSNLSGLIVGLNISTTPEEIYLAICEATAFGTKVIVDNFVDNGVKVNEFVASGGIANKNPFLMQIYADVLNMPIKIGGSTQGPAHSSAIFAAVAAGKNNGGYDSIVEASEKMGTEYSAVYHPNPEKVQKYETLYSIYKELYDIFGRENKIMNELKEIRLREKKAKDLTSEVKDNE